MKKEFFGVDVQEALSKASHVLCLPVEELQYKVMEQTFGHPLKQRKKGIFVEVDPAQQPRNADTVTQNTKSGHEVTCNKNQGQDEALDAAKDSVQRAKMFLLGLFRRMGIQAEVEATEEGDHVLLSLLLPASAIDLRKGEGRELRSAVQFLVGRVASGGSQEERKYYVDIGGKLEERKAQMTEVAKELAEKVLEVKKTLHIKLMDSQDRRLIHLALEGHTEVKTISQGDGKYRVLSIDQKQEGEV
jgi:spoIIIJ-associated protein